MIIENVLIFSLCALLLGCQDTKIDEEEIKWITATQEDVDLSDMNLYLQYDYNSSIAGKDAKLLLYVVAEEDENGNFYFDDGQEWVLLFESSYGTYVLFPRSYVQLGKVSCASFTDLEEDRFHVLVTVTQTASYQIYDCIFDEEIKSFEVIPVYNKTNIS